MTQQKIAHKPIVIGLAGYAGAGKDLTAFYISTLVKEYGAEIETTKFAYVLKQISGTILGVPSLLFEDPDFKAKKIGGVYGEMTYREFLQKLGTEAAQSLTKYVWVDALERSLEERGIVSYVISDMRFKHEADWIKSKGGYTINIVRPKVKAANNHKSESELDGYDFDLTILNDGNQFDLCAKLRIWITETYYL